MYIPRHFAVNDPDEQQAFIRANNFGQLISQTAGRLEATLMPFLLAEDGKSVLGHVAKLNPQHTELDGQQVLITLQGPHDYISPSWYSDPGVPTWNYQAIHIYGRCQVFTDEVRLQSLVNALTALHEAAMPQPWQPAYNPAMHRAIVGIEIRIDEIQCKYKLNQNRSEQDRLQVISQLRERGSSVLAEAMSRTLAAPSPASDAQK